MTDYQKYINALRKCAKEHENDKTFTGHIIVSDLCQDTANLLEELEQESILDKIYADIQRLRGCSCNCSDGIIDDVEDILDKYKAERSNEECSQE